MPKLRSVQQFQAFQGNSRIDERRDANSPEYINVQSVRALRQTNGILFGSADPAVIRSGGDGQEADEGQHINIKREDYYKASTLLYQQSSRPMQSSPVLDLYNQAMDEMKEKLPKLLPSNHVGLSKREQEEEEEEEDEDDDGEEDEDDDEEEEEDDDDDDDDEEDEEEEKKEEANCQSLSQSRNIISCKNQQPLSLSNKVHSEHNSSQVPSKMVCSVTFAKPEGAKEENNLSRSKSSANKSLNDNHPLSLFEIKKCKNGYKEEQIIKEKLRIEKKLGIEREEDECQEDVIKKLSKSFEEHKSRPPPNFVEERVLSLEKKSLESSTNGFNSWIRPKKDLFNDFRKKLGSSISVLSDSEVFDKCHDNNTDEDSLTTKSAPLTLSPLSSVLADLRKTAELRKERLFNLEKINKLRKSAFEEKFLNRSSLNSCPPKLQIKQIEKSLTEKQAQDKLEGKDFKNDEVGGDDNRGEADDEMSRDFDSLQYQNELQKNSLLPQSTKQLLISEHKSKSKKQITFDLERKQDDLNEQNAKISHNHSRLDSNCDRSADQNAIHAKYTSKATDCAHLFKMNEKEKRNADLNDQCLQSPTSANILDLIPEDYGIKFLNLERNQDTWNESGTKIKRSLTSDSLLEKYNDEYNNAFQSSTKKSKSLQDLDGDHLYENVEVFHIYQQTPNGPKLLNPSNTRPKVSDTQLSDSTSRSPQTKSSNKLPSIKEIDSEKGYYDERACKLINSSKMQKSSSLSCNKFDSSSMVTVKGIR